MGKQNSQDIDIDIHALRSMVVKEVREIKEVKAAQGSNIDLNALRKEVLGS